MIAVYNIDESIEKKANIGSAEIKNIDKILRILLGSDLSGIEGERFLYEINVNNHFLTRFSNEHFPHNTDNLDSTFDEIAHKLLSAELVEVDNEVRRNKNIKQGLLFIRFYENKLIFLKLEEIDSIDINTFEINQSYSIDKKYYKALIYSGDDSEIAVVDRNLRVANYWAINFLNLSRKRDSNKNTSEIIKMVRNGTILNHNLEKEDRDYYLNQLTNYLLTAHVFDLDSFCTSHIRNDKGLSPDQLKKTIFEQKKLSVIDPFFELDYSEKNKLSKVKLRISDSITINSNDFYDSVRKGEIIINKYDKLEISIAISQLEKVRSLMNQYKSGIKDV